MTCIVGINNKGVVTLGSDSQINQGWIKGTKKEGKVFQKGEFLYGVAGRV